MLHSFTIFKVHDEHSSSDEDETDVTIIKGIACNINEEPWIPHMNTHQHAEKSYHRQTIMIGIPARFKGDAGTHNIY